MVLQWYLSGVERFSDIHWFVYRMSPFFVHIPTATASSSLMILHEVVLNSLGRSHRDEIATVLCLYARSYVKRPFLLL